MSTLTGLISSGGGSEPPWERILPMSPTFATYLRYDGGYISSGATSFWDFLDIQGAYIATTDISSYTTIVNVTGTGRFGGVIGGEAGGSNTTNIRLTLDGVVKTYSIACDSLDRPVLYIPTDGTGDNTGILNTSTSNLSATAHKNYLQSTTVTTANPSAIYFKESLKVEIQSSVARYPSSPRNHSGVFYALTD